jgi:hypothetical protein
MHPCIGSKLSFCRSSFFLDCYSITMLPVFSLTTGVSFLILTTIILECPAGNLYEVFNRLYIAFHSVAATSACNLSNFPGRTGAGPTAKGSEVAT